MELGPLTDAGVTLAEVGLGVEWDGATVGGVVVGVAVEVDTTVGVAVVPVGVAVVTVGMAEVGGVVETVVDLGNATPYNTINHIVIMIWSSYLVEMTH